MTDDSYISATDPDWTRETPLAGRFESWKYMLAAIRRYQQVVSTRGRARFLRPWIVLRHRFWSAVCGTDIPITAQLGGGLLMPHPNGIVIIDADVAIDRLCLREISASLSRPGVQVVQTYNGVSNPNAGWRPALCDAAFNVFNHLRMADAAHLAGTVVLKGLGMGFRTPVLPQWVWLVAMQWLVLAGYVASGQIQRRAPLSTWLYLVAAPFFVLWKIPLYLKMVAGSQPMRWSRTAREVETDKENVF